VARDGSSGRNLSLIRISKVAIFSQKLVQSTGLIRRRIKEIFNYYHCQSWIQSKRATKRCNRHAEQERVYTKVYTRVEKFHVTRAQVWNVHCGIKGSIAHLSYGLPRR